MIEVIVKFDKASNIIFFPDGTSYCCSPAMEFKEAPSNDVLSLVKAGLTAEDLINLKKAEIL